MIKIIEKYKDWLVYLSLMMLLAPILFFPIATDTAIFIQAGKIIAHGGLPYVDFIDIKPPFIYFIFAFSISIINTAIVTNGIRIPIMRIFIVNAEANAHSMAKLILGRITNAINAFIAIAKNAIKTGSFEL